MKIISRNDAKKIGLTHYFTGKPCLRGHIEKRWTISARCIGCHYEDHPLKNITKLTEEERAINAKERAEKWYVENKQKTINRAKEWKSSNKEKVRISESKWRKKESSKAITFMRDSLRRVLRTEKNGRTEVILGYSRVELKTHIERQFTKGMSWENHGDWHIDHIIPISEFIRRGESDPKIINALSNLKPIWAVNNLKKNNKIITLL